jgi:hypothetical protein
MTFPVYQFTVQEEAMNGKAEFITGADFYFDWIGVMPVQDVQVSGQLTPTPLQDVQVSGQLTPTPVALTGTLPTDIEIDQDY